MNIRFYHARILTMAEGMKIITHDDELYEVRRTIIELTMSGSRMWERRGKRQAAQKAVRKAAEKNAAVKVSRTL